MSSLDQILGRYPGVIALERKQVSGHYQSFWIVNILYGFVELVSNLNRNSRMDEGAERVCTLQEMQKKATSELLGGAEIHTEVIVTVTRKRLDSGSKNAV